ncbi:class I SAM-dependent rRNA methyltransferase [Umboniibacter marinipuniceus]|uniref:SAM-dependent methyltransferase n=1 Tax=Umboniibacter marinipuniceus TaxID=569599 RepID=A0A3M0A6I7_9GAMM|nr:class I SAM-dependent rRNA methyltransferase [Umboniibacter marinipuniceus]RMA80216.1 SAM-dependent methyltransferase [Umboniibacter marinipuniceus]
MSDSLNTLFLKRGAEKRIRGGHLWLYSNEVDKQRSSLKTFGLGEQVLVKAHDDKRLGLAVMSPNNLICGRFLSRTKTSEFSKGDLKKRIRQALSLREMTYSQPYYRLVHGDADWLPGLVIDRFDDVFSVQLNSVFMDQFGPTVVNVINEVFEPKAIVYRNDSIARSDEGLEPNVEVILGELPEEVILIENDTRFRVPIMDGQKTGWFFDHRENRARLNGMLKGKRVLDVFSYVGGWGVQAARHGASEVVCVDASAFACEEVLANAERNGVAEQVSAITGNAFEVMKQLVDQGEHFDVVIVDPPALIKRRKDLKQGEQAYHRLNQLAIRLLGSEGTLVSASCSMHLGRERLGEVVRVASRHVDRQAQIFFDGRQGFDHPVHPAIPETDYLKAIFCRVVRELS